MRRLLRIRSELIGSGLMRGLALMPAQLARRRDAFGKELARACRELDQPRVRLVHEANSPVANVVAKSIPEG